MKSCTIHRDIIDLCWERYKIFILFKLIFLLIILLNYIMSGRQLLPFAMVMAVVVRRQATLDLRPCFYAEAWQVGQPSHFFLY